MPFDPVGYVETKIVDADGEVLLGAINLINKHGHNAGWSAMGDRGELCIGCAIACSFSGRLSGNGAGWRFVSQIAAERLGFRHVGEMFAWNANPHRTAAEVIARLRSAAEQGAS